MLNHVQIKRMINKLERFAEMLDPMLFSPIADVPVSSFQTLEQFHQIPDNVEWTPVQAGDMWGGESMYCWFKGAYTVPDEFAGQELYLRPEAGGYEAMMFVNNIPLGTFATKIVVTGHGNHYCNQITPSAKAGETIDLALEYYAGHYVKGELAFQTRPRTDFRFPFQKMEICVKNHEIAKFFLDLTTILSLYTALDDRSYRKGELENAFTELHKVLYYSPENVSNELFMDAIRKGQEILDPVMAKTNGGATMPYAGVIGHSHMDTAWLWHIAETVKKCARTYANQMNLMAQYPDYTFVQSSSYHSDMIREHYPELFERIKEQVAAGRYEPNGGVWVECDANVTSGESMIRQFLWGQRFTREHFNFTSDCFWLPDTFGYSAAIPQIMKGCGVDFFLTTKIAWNDTNPFPYDSFYWKGIDGTKVFSHFNKTHIGSAPHELMPLFYNSENNDAVRQKNVSQSKLVSFGYGDGGGGPQWDQIEIANRCRDLEGCPRYAFTTVSEFMHKLEAEVVDPAIYEGELYLELHRGTLTNQHEIKRNNRLGEIALHDLEFATVSKAVLAGEKASDGKFRHLQNRLLVNQFHDILPGTCIPRANRESREEMTALLEESAALLQETAAVAQGESVTVLNTTSFPRNDVIYLEDTGAFVEGATQQQVTTLDGGKKLAVANVTQAPLSAKTLRLTAEKPAAEAASPFTYANRVLETPFATVSFTEEGTISSFYDKRAKRELCGEGYPLNTFLVAEDVPSEWDSWDVDADVELKLAPAAKLLSEEVVANGAVEFRFRRKYQLTEKSSITQDMIFQASDPAVRFETMMHWYDDHRLLKTAFDTSIFSDFVRQEIQFGFQKRPTTRNTSVEQAKFEVLNHKYTDLSEPNFGIAILNDCKYAISAYGGQLRLTLHKGGLRPDWEGDKGEHYCEYAFLPHEGGFSAETVVAPAYTFNYKPQIFNGSAAFASLAQTANANVVIETIKPCEDAENAFILRLYETEGGMTHTTLSLGQSPKAAALCNMLEETLESLPAETAIPLTFRPFEIKTVKISY